ncbi:MAG: hypothetical protein JWP25_2040 [Bradyrhizobium sp.]|nr:hypothetical protein [Bradyrhizobium sp.]
MPERRRFTQTTSLEERLAKEATQLRRQARGTLPGVERDLLVRKARRAETTSRMTEWLATGDEHHDKAQEMAISRLLKSSTLEPEEIARLTKAYEQALYTLSVKDRDDPLTEMIAKKIIKIAQAGVHDAAQLSALAVAELRIR